MSLDKLNERGCKEGLAQASEVMRRMRVLERTALEQQDKATEYLNDIRSMIGFAELWREFLRTRLDAIEKAKEHGTPPP